MIKRTLLLLLAALALGACATIGGTKQVVSVDSVPRGAEVYLHGDDHPIGTTPFFYRMARVPDDEFDFHFPGGKPVTVDVKCRYRWLVEGFGDGALVLLSPEAAAGGFILDYVTGAAFDCGPSIVAKGPESLDTRRVSYCKQYLIAPPKHTDELLSDRIATIWAGRAKMQLQGCDAIIPFQEGKRSWEYLNIDSQDGVLKDRIGRERFNRLGLETGATHLVILNYTVKGDTVSIEPEITDLHTFQPVDAKAMRVVSVGERDFDVSRGHLAFAYTFSLLPNAVTLGYSSYQSKVRGSNGLVSDSTVTERLPSLGAFGLTSIEHPAGYSDWDFVASLYPSVSILSFDHDELSLTYFAPLYHGGITLHTFIGAFAADVGAGLATYRFKRPGEHAAMGLTPVMSTGFNYTAFLSHDVFIQMGTINYGFGVDDLEAGTLKVSPHVSEGYFQFGYFIPDIKHRARHWF